MESFRKEGNKRKMVKSKQDSDSHILFLRFRGAVPNGIIV